MIERSRTSANGGQGGHSYLASVSDLVSALIFVFIIMLAVFAYQLANVTEGLNSADKTREVILQGIAKRLKDADLRVKVLYDQGVLRLSDNAINFPLGSENPITNHQVNVGRLAEAIAEVVPCHVSRTPETSEMPAVAQLPRSDQAHRPQYCQPPADPSKYDCKKRTFPWLLETLLIEGHTDNVPVGSGNRYEDNLELSSMRAAKVHRMITACEPSVERLLNTDGHPILSTSGYGYTRPATPDPDRIDENRRIDLRFLLEPPEGALSPIEPEVQAETRERYGEGAP